MSLPRSNRRVRRGSRALAALFAVVALALVTLAVKPAAAYPWMIRHEYTGCAMCHVDPSGGGVLTEYGRAQSDVILRMNYGKPAEEPSTTSRFLWAVKEPEWLHLGGSYRGLVLVDKAGSAPAVTRFVQMQADLRGAITASFARVGGSIGYDHQGAQAAQLTSREKDNLVAREYWAGASLLDDTLLVRAGRINMPFGLRHVEHTMWVRKETRTDINTGQQHGLAVSLSKDTIRGEIMAIAGNLQLHPDAYRERGYAGYFEWSPMPKLSAGVSSLMTTALADVDTRTTTFRQAHGLFVRAAPLRPLVLMAEGDALFRSPTSEPTIVGAAGMVQADVEPIQGLHVFATGELKTDTTGEKKADGSRVGPSVGGWLSVDWFFLPHVDLRLDGVLQSLGTASGAASNTMFLAQLHAFL